jgi:hypothetical protein
MSFHHFDLIRTWRKTALLIRQYKATIIISLVIVDPGNCLPLICDVKV